MHQLVDLGVRRENARKRRKGGHNVKNEGEERENKPLVRENTQRSTSKSAFTSGLRMRLNKDSQKDPWFSL